MERRQVVVLLAGIVAIAWAAPLIRLADAVPAIVIAAMRLSLAAPPMLGIAAWHAPREFRLIRRQDALVLLLSAIALAAHFAFWVASLQRTSVLSSVALVTMQPLFVALGAWLVLRERPSGGVLAGIACGFAGAVVLFADGAGDVGSLTGNALAVCGAAAAGVYLVAGRGMRQRFSMPVYTASVYSVTAVLLLVAVAASGETLHGHPGDAWLYLVLLALVPQLIGHNALNWALGSVPAAIVAVAILGEPIGAAVIAFLLLDEVPSPLELAGGALLLAGVALALLTAGRGVAPRSVAPRVPPGVAPEPPVDPRPDRRYADPGDR